MNGHSSEKRRVARSNGNLTLKRFKTLSVRPYSKFSYSSNFKRSYLSKSKAKSSIKLLASALLQEKQDLNAELRQQALREARSGNHQNAIALFNELVTRDPSNASHYNNRGLVYFQMSELDQAIADYNTAINLNPSLDSAYNNRANYYACKGQLLSAILDYDVAINLNPGNVRAWINQGITFRELHMFERSVECFDTALNFQQIEGNIYAERGRTYHLWGDWNMAIADYNRATVLIPFSADALLSSSGRLRLQVELWIDDLLNPLDPDSCE